MDNQTLETVFRATNGQKQQRTTLYDAAGNVVAFGSGGTSTQDEATFTPGTSLGVPVMGVMDDVAPDSLSEGQQGIIRATPTRGLHVTLYDAAGNEVSVGGGTQYVTGTASAGPTGTVALGWDGANVRAVKTDANGEAQVDVLTSTLPTGAATEATLSAVSADADDIRLGIGATTDAAATAGSTGSVNAKLRLVTTQLAGNLISVGSVAHDSADSTAPVKIGNKAVAYGATPTAVNAGDRTDAYANVAGVPFILGGHPNIITRRDNYTAAQTDTAIVTIAGGTKIVVVACTVTADKANSVDVAVRVGFGAANTPTGAGVYLSHPGLAASSGGGIREAGAVAGADGEDLRITCEVPTGGSIDVVTKYFLIAE